MPLIDSTSGKVLRRASIEQLKDAAKLMRGYNLVGLHAAGSGHAGARFPSWISRQRSTSASLPTIPRTPTGSTASHYLVHRAQGPELDLGLAFAGFCPLET